MTTTITIHNDNQVNIPLSLALPSSTIVIHFQCTQQPNNNVQNSCEYCKQSNSVQTNDKKDAKTNEVINHVKDEIIDIKPYDIKTEEEHHAIFDVDERLSNNDQYIYNGPFSPISSPCSIDTENKQVNAAQHHDENFNLMIKESFQDISEIVEYLKQDIMMN